MANNYLNYLNLVFKYKTKYNMFSKNYLGLKIKKVINYWSKIIIGIIIVEGNYIANGMKCVTIISIINLVL